MNNWFSSFFSSKAYTHKPEPTQFLEGLTAYQEGMKLFSIKDYTKKTDEQALVFFDKAIKCGVKDANGDRAFCLQGLNYHYDAIKDFDQAISNSKDDANLYFGRGHSKKIITDYDGAITDLKQAVELSKVRKKLNEEYNDTMSKSGWKSASQYFFSQLEDALYRKEASQKENLKKVYLEIANKIERRPK